MSLNPRTIKESFARIEPFADKATAYFYGRLFTENPRLRALFPPAMDVQRDRLFQALTKIAWSLDSPDALAAYLGGLGRDHRKYGVLSEHYAAVGHALIATIRKFSGDAWSNEIEAAWVTAYNTAAGLMIQSAEQNSSSTPPWWIAEVLEHERHGGDIATLTVRTNQSFPYAAGQYVTVQTARWPRVWRHFSIANAPRDDGTLRFHVRALPAGWVSGALVRDTRAGDSLLLGPPMGTMTLAPDSGRDLLLVAGGTGLAPLKAIAEQVVRSGRHSDIHLIVGARTGRDLYDLYDLRLLEANHPRLSVVPVVSDDPGFEGLRGPVPEVLHKFRNLEDHEAYVAGPPCMIDATVRRLQELGVPADRIHHDRLEPGWTTDGEGKAV